MQNATSSRPSWLNLQVYDAVFDTLGDDEPGGMELSWERIELRGHPGYLDDICPLALDLLEPCTDGSERPGWWRRAFSRPDRGYGR